MAEKTLAEISKKLRDIDFTILSTRTGGGAIAGRPMSNNRDVDFDGDAWFFTCDDTRTVADIIRDPHVGLGYQGKSGALGFKPFFVSVEGRAELIRDKASFADQWTKDLDRWFEQGIDTPGLVLIKVVAERLPLLGRLRRRRAQAVGAGEGLERSAVSANRHPGLDPGSIVISGLCRSG